MKKLLLVFFVLFSFNCSVKADFGIWGSAVYLNVNGTAGFYNTQKLTGPGCIGTAIFGGQLGVFGYNSGTLKILGAEINTSKDNNINICGGSLYYLVYPQGSRPALPVFSDFNLSMYCNCNGTSFNSCGGGACSGINEQKFQNAGQSIDLTGYPIGNYTLEIYYQVNGETSSSPCNLHRFDNAAGANYKADFSITSPLAINFVALNGIASDNNINIKWVVQNDVNISRYEVQKSENGMNFTTLNSITANHNTTASSYFFTDNNPIVGSNYYRIKVYHINNTVGLSNIFRTYFGKVGNTIFIYPNPAGTELAVRLAAINKGMYQMSVLDNGGRTILTVPVNHDGTDKTIRVTMPYGLSRAVYRLLLIDKYKFYKQSFLVK